MELINQVIPVFKIGSGCDYHRVILPFKTMGFDFDRINRDGMRMLREAKLMVFNRLPIVQDVVLKAREEYGTKLLMDLDDYWVLYPEHPMYHQWYKFKFPERLIELIKISDGIMVTTELLAEKVRPLNKHVYVVPNAIPFEGQFVPTEKDSKTTRFGYLGGSSHVADLRRIEGVFNHFPTLDFTLFGYQDLPSHAKGKNVWDVIEKIVNFNGNNPNYKRVQAKSLETYMNNYDQIDVSIAPLVDVPFNKYKSSLKFYEAGAKKCGFICSDMSPYADDVPRDIAFFCKNNKDWVEAIKKCKDISLVRELGEKAYEWVKANRNMEDINKVRLNIFEEIINRET